MKQTQAARKITLKVAVNARKHFCSPVTERAGKVSPCKWRRIYCVLLSRLLHGCCRFLRSLQGALVLLPRFILIFLPGEVSAMCGVSWQKGAVQWEGSQGVQNRTASFISICFYLSLMESSSFAIITQFLVFLEVVRGGLDCDTEFYLKNENMCQQVRSKKHQGRKWAQLCSK